MKTEYEFLKDKNVRAVVIPIELSLGKVTNENTMNINLELLDAIPFYSAYSANSAYSAKEYLKELQEEELFGILVKVNEDGTFEFLKEQKSNKIINIITDKSELPSHFNNEEVVKVLKDLPNHILQKINKDNN